jgi:transposase
MEYLQSPHFEDETFLLTKEHSCCGGHHEEVTPLPQAKYFCPISDGVVWDLSGVRPKWGMR